MTSRTVQVANTCGESVRVKVIYRDGNIEDIKLDNNNIKVFEISDVHFLEPHDCELNIFVYKLGDDILPAKRIIPANKNNYFVSIKKGNTGFETSLTEI